MLADKMDCFEMKKPPSEHEVQNDMKIRKYEGKSQNVMLKKICQHDIAWPQNAKQSPANVSSIFQRLQEEEQFRYQLQH
jgi:hypothetical protein